MTKYVAFLALALGAGPALTSCSGDEVPAGAPSAGASGQGGGAGDAGGTQGGNGGGPGAGGGGAGGVTPPITCGSGTVEANTLTRGNAIAIANDGTIYHDYYSGAVEGIARTRPAQAQELEWAIVGTDGDGADALAVSPDGAELFLIKSTREGPSTYSYQIEVIDTRAAVPAPRPLGEPFPSDTPAPTALATSPKGELFVGGFFGIMRVSDDGARAPIATGLEVAHLVHTGDALVANVYNVGVVRMNPDGSSRVTLLGNETRALQDIGVDALGRFYATDFGNFGGESQERLLRFGPTFENEEVLFTHLKGGLSFSMQDFAFGKGALACDVYIVGFEQSFRVPVGTAGLP